MAASAQWPSYKISPRTITVKLNKTKPTSGLVESNLKTLRGDKLKCNAKLGEKHCCRMVPGELVLKADRGSVRS